MSVDLDNMKKQNVLIVHNYYQIPGGEDTVVANEKKMLEEHGHKVAFYSRNNSELKEMSLFRKLMLPITTIFNLRTYRDIKKIINEQSIEIVHVHNTLSLISPAVYYAALRCKVPVVQTIHNFRLLCPGATFYRDGHICEDCIKNGLHCALKYNCYRRSKLQTLICVISAKIHRITGIYGKINYICLTSFNKRKMLKLKTIKPTRVFVKPNFVEESKEIDPKNQRHDRFVFAGRLEKLKGLDILLKAWKQMNSEAPKLVICGVGPMEAWCRQYIKSNRLNVEMLGFVPNDEVIRIFANSRAMILPTQWYEGFPMSIVEAYSVATPVITGNIGNAGDLVDDGITGIKFAYDSADSLAEAVKQIEQIDSCTLGKNAYLKYIEQFNEKRNYETLRDIYSNIEKNV